MRFITVSQLQREATRIVAEVVDTKAEFVITRNGLPVAIVRPFTERDLASVPKREERHGKA